jgi:putative transposase
MNGEAAPDAGARRIIRDWLHWYNEGRPHSVLGYRSPVQYRAQQSTLVA